MSNSSPPKAPRAGAGALPARRMLLSVARRAGVRVGYPCRGVGVCGRCTVTVVSGASALPPPTEKEAALLAREKLGPDDRISCLVPAPEGAALVLRVGGADHALVVPRRPER